MAADPLDFLFGLEQFGIKFGLDSITAIAAHLGHPERSFRSVHIAGTNGKGSVTAMVDAALHAAGYRSARYTSPHLIDLTERFVIDGRLVARAELVDVAGDVRRAIETLLSTGVLQAPPTFFEATTAAAFELFRRAGVEIAVLEVGLGGRLDSTNIVSPTICAITSIAFDHEAYLGRTLRDIALEKAGIIKPGVPLVVGELDPEAMSAVVEVAGERGAEVIRSSANDARNFRVGLEGAHQRANAGIAVKVLEALNDSGIAVSAPAIAAGLAQPGWPGRLDLRRLPDGREVLLDAAHNPAGAAALASYLEQRSPARLPLVLAAMRDKDVDGMLRALAPAVGHLVATRASNQRSMDPEELVARAGAIAPHLGATAAPSPTAALAAAWRLSPRIVAAGSIFLLGDVLKAIDAELDQ